MSDTLDKRLGKCYQLAAQYVLDNTDCILVHGTIQGYDNPRIGHAWVECKDGSIYDAVLQKHLPLIVYEALLNPIADQRFTSTQTCINMCKYKVWGPWSNLNGNESEKEWKKKIKAFNAALPKLAERP